jgi:hypothetical protein
MTTATPQEKADDIVATYERKVAAVRARKTRIAPGAQFHAIVDDELYPFRCIDDLGCAVYAYGDDDAKIRRNVDAALIVDDADVFARWDLDEAREVFWLTFEGVLYVADGYDGRGVHVWGNDADNDPERDRRLAIIGLVTDGPDGLVAVT